MGCYIFLQTLKYIDMDHEFIKLDSGIKIHFKEFGESGPKLLLVHGWNNDWSGFVPLIENLESKFKITTIDLPGYGLSEPIHGEYTIESLSDVVCEFIDKKCDGRVDLVCALSMGSVIVADFAKRHREKTKVVVLIGPPIIKYDWIWSRMYRKLITFVNKKVID